MIIVQDTETAECKFTVIFEPEEVYMLEEVIDASEGEKNFEDALYELLTGWIPKPRDIVKRLSSLISMLRQKSLWPMLNLDEKATVRKVETVIKESEVSEVYTITLTKADIELLQYDYNCVESVIKDIMEQVKKQEPTGKLPPVQ